MADERLLIEAAQKDPARFAGLYEEHFERVYAYVLRRVCDRTESQDITADVFQQALANIGRFEWRGAPFASWLFRIAANAIADHFQRKARQSSAPPPPASSTDEDYDEVERRAALFRSVNLLPPDQRRVIVMRFGEEKSIREIAQEIGRSEGAVKQLQWRGLQSLRAQMIHG